MNPLSLPAFASLPLPATHSATFLELTGRRVWRRRLHLAYLRGVTVLLASGQVAAQTPPTAVPPGRLTVRPHEMATGAANPAAGEHSLDSLPGYAVYVSKSCVGAHRCPLVVALGGGGYGARRIMEMHARYAEKYGMILLAPEQLHPGRFDLLDSFMKDELKMDGYTNDRVNSKIPLVVREAPNVADVQNIDAALKQVLRTYAIDPERIAVTGMSDGGSYALFLGFSNPDVFSRIAPLSPGIPFYGVGPHNEATRVFLSGGIAEQSFLRSALIATRYARDDAYPVKQVLSLRPHENRAEEHDFMWHWLQTSWAAPGSAAEAAPRVADPLPVLTAAMVTQMTTFWEHFLQEPDSIATTARLARLKEVAVPVGQEWLSVLMTDMPALAAAYPSVAADLEQAGLTAEQHQAYRAALVSAQATRQAGKYAGKAAAASPLQQNLEFLEAHSSMLDALEATGMWITP